MSHPDLPSGPWFDPDLPPEESGELRQALRAHGLALITLLAPTSTEERIALGTKDAEGFVY
jgi:tryptophan synthase alpha chain